MATNNAVNYAPVQHAVIVGAASGGITSLSVGGTGTLLVGAATADPAFATSAVGDFTFTSSTAGATRTLTVSNTDNSNTASNANILASVGGASAGDATHQASTTTTVWTWGVDNSVTSPTADPFVIAQGTALGTNNVMSIDTAGAINYPLQPAFLAYLNSTVTNKTGNGALYTLGTDALTKVFDQGTNFNTNGTFTAPVTGRYSVYAQINTSNNVLSTSCNYKIVTSNRNLYNNYSFAVASGTHPFSMSTLIDMDAADTFTVQVNVNGESGNTVGFTGDANDLRTSMAAYLVC